MKDVLKDVFLKVDNFFDFQPFVLKFRPVMRIRKLYSLSNVGGGVKMCRKWRNRKLIIYRKITVITPTGYVRFQIWLQIRNGREMLDGGNRD
jgi:hypothetical protein